MMPGEEWLPDQWAPEAYRSMGQGDPLAPGIDVPPWLEALPYWIDAGRPLDAAGWLRGIHRLFPYEFDRPRCPRHPGTARADCPCQSSAELEAVGLLDPGIFLPTTPGTQLEFAARAWPRCRTCRALAWLHLARLYDRHIDRRHPDHPIRLVLPRLGTFMRLPRDE